VETCEHMIPSVSLCLLTASKAADTLAEGPLDRVVVPLCLALRQMEREAWDLHAEDVPGIFEEAYACGVAANVSLLLYAEARGSVQRSQYRDRVVDLLRQAQLAWGAVVWSGMGVSSCPAEC
jgi:hypothetical protein